MRVILITLLVVLPTERLLGEDFLPLFSENVSRTDQVLSYVASVRTISELASTARDTGRFSSRLVTSDSIVAYDRTTRSLLCVNRELSTTRYAKFRSFVLQNAELVAFLKGKFHKSRTLDYSDPAVFHTAHIEGAMDPLCQGWGSSMVARSFIPAEVLFPHHATGWSYDEDHSEDETDVFVRTGQKLTFDKNGCPVKFEISDEFSTEIEYSERNGIRLPVKCRTWTSTKRQAIEFEWLAINCQFPKDYFETSTIAERLNSEIGDALTLAATNFDPPSLDQSPDPVRSLFDDTLVPLVAFVMDKRFLEHEFSISKETKDQFAEIYEFVYENLPDYRELPKFQRETGGVVAKVSKQADERAEKLLTEVLDPKQTDDLVRQLLLHHGFEILASKFVARRFEIDEETRQKFAAAICSLVLTPHYQPSLNPIECSIDQQAPEIINGELALFQIARAIFGEAKMQEVSELLGGKKLPPTIGFRLPTP